MFVEMSIFKIRGTNSQRKFHIAIVLACDDTFDYFSLFARSPSYIQFLLSIFITPSLERSEK